MSTRPPAPTFKPFNLTLIQLGQISADKAANLKHARDMIRKAANDERTNGNTQGPGKPDLIVLPECFNSPYGHVHFPVYAESIGFIKGEKYDIDASQSESVKMLSEAAKTEGVWLLGGPSAFSDLSSESWSTYLPSTGSIPEKDPSDGNVYNTSTVYSPQGELVATHRKVHLFDIDIPGKITFKESETLTGGSTTNFFDTGELRIQNSRASDSVFVMMYASRSSQRSQRVKARCQVLIYPGAFNMTTGPLHWELLQRARAVDNQVYFSMCSPARDLTAGYHAWGHSLVVDPMGSKLVEAEDGETILHTRIDPKTFNDARAGIPVTVQRRFDVYPDVSEEL
ncbi:carbon-nitrogen hydrolase [Lactarius pseudohatsudake]|nr:carbon-nitrogen hydrolase [Lactarius pseudohatsudake]